MLEQCLVRPDCAPNGVIHADTLGSDYNTVLIAHTGSCGALSERACNDDAVGFTSDVTFPVTSGETIVLEITSYGTGGGGTLELNVECVSAAPTCGAAPLGECRQPLPEKALLKLTNKTPDTSDGLQWKSTKGATTAKPRLRHPDRALGGYALCIYDRIAGDRRQPDVDLPGWRAGGRHLRRKAVLEGDEHRLHVQEQDQRERHPEHGAQGRRRREGEPEGQGEGTNLAMPTMPLAQDTTARIGGVASTDLDPSSVTSTTLDGGLGGGDRERRGLLEGLRLAQLVVAHELRRLVGTGAAPPRQHCTGGNRACWA